MVAVHARKGEEKKKISLNDKFQPICDNRKDRAEFSLFLGTLAKEYVSLEYVTWHKISNKNMLWEFVKYIIAEEGKPWVLKAMRDAWKVYKCRIKKDRYNKFTNDEDRIKHKPNDITMEVFKKLLNYWGDKKVKVITARNAENRRKISDTHTAGPRSFAQIRKEMSASRDGQEPSLAEMFIETRKRKAGKTYKTKTDVMNYRIRCAHLVQQVRVLSN